MTQLEQQTAAKTFSENWAGKGDEKQDSQRYWIGILGDVLGVSSPQNYIQFEKRVKLSHTSFIDAYIPETKVLIEQKGIKIDLNKAYEQSDGTVLTPYQQAKRYSDELPLNLKPRWIVVSNFAEIHVHDMNKPDEPPEIIFLKDLKKDFYRLDFLVDRKNENIRREVDISVAAGALVGKMYDALVKEYINPTAESYRSLNILCVRLVFCFYAEDAGLFETRTSFEDYIKSFAIENLRDGMIKLFKALDTKLDSRDKYDLKLKPFPYVNGGLFHDENIEIPNFTQEIVDVLVNDCAPFNWSEISPTIFGAVFESTLNPETRRKGGMHYTSIENIHRLIDPLFLDELNEELDEIIGIRDQGSGIRNQGPGIRGQGKQRAAALYAFQKKLGSLTFLDPACGSGNFLTETYLSLRRLENKVISALNKGEKALGFDEFIHVRINQFYGIEINDFAVTVAKTALWIAESQMINETEKILGQQIDFLPLKTNAYIVEGNALRMDWTTLTNLDGTKAEQPMLFDEVVEPLPVGRQVVARRHERSEVTTSNGNGHFDKLNERTVAQSPHHYNYIMGNPPFVGNNQMSESQRKDLMPFFQKNKTADYVCCWYKKAAELIQNSKTKCAFVSTNSITQGEQVAILWKDLFNDFNIQIDFAYRTFRWDSESTEKAHVHCVIIGFSSKRNVVVEPVETITCNRKDKKGDFDVAQSPHDKFIIDEKGERHTAQNINGYLLDAPNITVESRSKPICDVPKMRKVNQPTDGGNLIIEEKDYAEFIKKEPNAKRFIKPLLGAEEFINNKKRYCLWLVNTTPAELRRMPLVMRRLEACRALRLKSSDKNTRKLADTPWLFRETVNPPTALVVPRVSSERRKYVPIGFIDDSVIVTDAVQLIPDATLFHFGVLTSSVHMAWMRAVCGRLEMRYRYSKDIVYNNFVWPDARSTQVSGARNQGLENREEEKDGEELQGIDCLAEGNGCNAGNLSACKETAERGDLRALGSNEAGGGFDSVEHSGGKRQKLNKGIRAVSVDSERLSLRAGNSADSLREDKVFVGAGNSATDGLASRSGKNAQHDYCEAEKLTPNPYSLITKTAQAILDARAKYPDSSLADLYDETLMPADLRKAHEANDRAVMQAYGFDKSASESEIVAELFKLYQKLCASFTK